MKEINLPNVTRIGSAFMYLNDSLKSISIPNLQSVGIGFLYINSSVEELDIPTFNFDNNYLNILLEDSTRSKIR